MQCPVHPDVETELRCSKCETLICPRCMVQTPVGARCRSCANLRRPVLYATTPLTLARAAAAAIGVALVVGLFWAFLLPTALNAFGFFVFFPAAGFGWLTATAIGRATDRHRGPQLQAIAVASCILVYLVHNIVGPLHALLPINDIIGYLFVAIAGFVSVGYLR